MICFILLLAQILSIDIGNSRIKMGTFDEIKTLEDLQKIDVQIHPSKGWLSENFPLYLKNALQDSKYDQIALALPTPIINKSQLFRTDLPLPVEIKRALEAALAKPCSVENDAVNWMHGIIQTAPLIGRKISYPLICLALGSGIGCSIAYDEQDVRGFELSYTNFPFKNLKAASKDQNGLKLNGRWSAHRIMGRGFLNYAENMDLEVRKRAYKMRLSALLKDLRESFARTVLEKAEIHICGGMAHLLEEDDEYFLWNKKTLEPFQLQPEVISLYGGTFSALR